MHSVEQGWGKLPEQEGTKTQFPLEINFDLWSPDPLQTRGRRSEDGSSDPARLVEGGHHLAEVHRSGLDQPIHLVRRLHQLQVRDGAHQDLRPGRRGTQEAGQLLPNVL